MFSTLVAYNCNGPDHQKTISAYSGSPPHTVEQFCSMKSQINDSYYKSSYLYEILTKIYSPLQYFHLQYLGHFHNQLLPEIKHIKYQIN
jgi:hypothetical protein